MCPLPELPVQIVRPLRVKIAMYRHRGLLECQVSRPNAQVKWYKNRKELLPSKKYQVINQDVYRQLYIDDVCSSDEDTYTCDAGDDQTSCQLLVEGEIPHSDAVMWPVHVELRVSRGDVCCGCTCRAGYQHSARNELCGGDGAPASTVPGGDQPKIRKTTQMDPEWRGPRAQCSGEHQQEGHRPQPLSDLH